MKCVEVQNPRRPKRTHARFDIGEALTKLGARCTGDHLTRQRGLGSEGDAFYDDANSALMIYDRGADWLGCYPSATRSIEHTVEAFKQWAGPKENMQAFYSDNAHELVGAARKCGWRCATAATRIPPDQWSRRTNGSQRQRGRTMQSCPVRLA